MRWFAAATAIVILALTAACADKTPPPACPARVFLKDASVITAFRDGPGRDITDIDYRASFFDAGGQCEYDLEEKKLTIVSQAIFEIEPGPTSEAAQIRIPYFVAIVKKGNVLIEKQGFKETFEAVATLPERRTTFRFQDAAIDIELPIGGDIDPREIEIMFGFQLTEEQLNYNRAQLRR